jgi:hypothetical protein
MGAKAAHELGSDIPEEAVREKMMALGKGEFSDVIKTNVLMRTATGTDFAPGWVFFRAEEAVQEADGSDPAVLERVRTYVRNYERGRMEDWALEVANGFVAQVNEIGFESAVSDRGLETRRFGPVPVNYGDFGLFITLGSQQVSEISGAASDENFWRTAFSTPVNTPSQPVVRGSNVLVLFPTEETEAEEETIEGITSLFVANIRNISEQSLRTFIINSPKMDDKFTDMYFRLFMPQGN